MKFDNVRFELGLKSCDLRRDRDDCLEDIKRIRQQLMNLKNRLGMLTRDLVDITTETKQLRERLNDNYQLVEKYERLIEEFEKAEEVLRTVED